MVSPTSASLVIPLLVVMTAVGRAESNSNPDVVTSPGSGRATVARVFRMVFSDGQL